MKLVANAKMFSWKAKTSKSPQTWKCGVAVEYPGSLPENWLSSLFSILQNVPVYKFTKPEVSQLDLLQGQLLGRPDA